LREGANAPSDSERKDAAVARSPSSRDKTGNETEDPGTARPEGPAAPEGSAPVEEGGAPRRPGPEAADGETPEAGTAAADEIADAAPGAAGDAPETDAVRTGAETATEAPAAAPPPTEAPRRGGGFVALLLGGAAAAVIGFAAARYVIPEGWPTGAPPVAEQDAKVAAEARAALEARIAALESAPAEAVAPEALESAVSAAKTALEAEVTALAAEVSALSGGIEALAARLDALEARGLAAGEGGGAETAAALSGYRQELAELRAALEERDSRNEALAAEIAAAAEAAEARIAAAESRADALAETARGADAALALTRLRAAVETGQPFAGPLADLDAALGDLPEALATHAQAGVATLPELQRRFPGAAREGLAAALKATVGEGWGDRFAAFLRAQVGARSLEPRDGDDPDAVLSRAEAALDSGDVGAALAELSALPGEGRDAMSGWIAAAEARQAVTAALDSAAAAGQ
jgi:hypothetical protein